MAEAKKKTTVRRALGTRPLPVQCACTRTCSKARDGGDGGTMQVCTMMDMALPHISPVAWPMVWNMPLPGLICCAAPLRTLAHPCAPLRHSPLFSPPCLLGYRVDISVCIARLPRVAQPQTIVKFVTDLVDGSIEAPAASGGGDKAATLGAGGLLAVGKGLGGRYVASIHFYVSLPMACGTRCRCCCLPGNSCYLCCGEVRLSMALGESVSVGCEQL